MSGAHIHDWRCMLDDFFEALLLKLSPADVATCRLVCRAWLSQVALTLARLQPRGTCNLLDLPTTFPALAALELAAGQGVEQLSVLGMRCNGWAYVHLSPAKLQPLAALNRLQHVQMHGVALDLAAGLPLPLSLRHLAMCDVVLTLSLESRPSSALGSLGSLAAPLVAFTALTHLHLSGRRLQGDSAAPLKGLSQLHRLQQLHLSGVSCMSDATCVEAAALPHLNALELLNSSWWEGSRGTEGVSDAGMHVLRVLRSSLTRLVLHGHPRLTPAALPALCQLTRLHYLDLRLPTRLDVTPPSLRDQDLAALSTLSCLHSLVLSGCDVGTAACQALACLPRLAHLELHDCPSLLDSGLYELLQPGPPLRRLSLRSCPSVSDIGLAAVARHARGITALDLSGCHRNVTDTGLAAVAELPALRTLVLAHCEAISDAGVHVLAAGGKLLETLDLTDCAITDKGCAALALLAPRLRFLGLEHCAQVTDKGAETLGRLRRLEEVRLFRSGVSAAGAAALREAGARVGWQRVKVTITKPCWWHITPSR